MKNGTLSILALLMLSLICFNIIEAQTDSLLYHFYDGKMREFKVHIPSQNALQPRALVFVFHGGSNAQDIQIRTKFDSIGDIENFITVFPQAYKFITVPPKERDGLWADTRGTYADKQNIDDVGFTSYILDTLINLYNIDTTRIYACGLSAGGYFCQRLALQLNHRIAAFASVAASLPTSLIPFFPPSRGIPMLFMNGTDDLSNPYFGGKAGTAGVALPTETAFAHWASAGTCFNKFPILYNFPDRNTADFTSVTRSTYYPCSDCSEVVLYRIDKGGHTWPGTKNTTAAQASLGLINGDINGTKEIWLFFQRHRL